MLMYTVNVWYGVPSVHIYIYIYIYICAVYVLQYVVIKKLYSMHTSVDIFYVRNNSYIYIYNNININVHAG